MSIIVFETIDLMDIFEGFEKVANRKIKKAGYKQIKMDDPLLKEKCSICLEEYKIKEYKRSLFCNHVFHKKCCDRWLKKNDSCPICRNSTI